MLNIVPIFIYSGWRTGGSALAFHFRAQNDCVLFYDPLNRALENPKEATFVDTNSWKSNHPKNQNYFEEYSEYITDDNKLPKFPNLDKFTLLPNDATWDQTLYEYINHLVLSCSTKGKIPVFKFEQLEGRVNQLKNWFPNSVHIGLERDSEYQFLSFLEQATFGSFGFFSSAMKFIDPTAAIDDSMKYNFGYLENIFNEYFKIRNSLLKECDIIINVSPESINSLNENVQYLCILFPEYTEIWTNTFNTLERVPELTSVDKLKRALISLLELQKLTS